MRITKRYPSPEDLEAIYNDPQSKGQQLWECVFCEALFDDEDDLIGGLCGDCSNDGEQSEGGR